MNKETVDFYEQWSDKEAEKQTAVMVDSLIQKVCKRLFRVFRCLGDATLLIDILTIT